MSDTLHDAAERLIASMPDGAPADGIRQRARQRRRRRNITWIAAAVLVTTGGLATVRLVQRSPQELVPADSAPTPSISILPTTTVAPAPTTVPATNTVPATTTSTTFPNRPPIAVSDLVLMTDGMTVSIPVIANDIDVDGDRLHLVSVAAVSSGSATIDGDQVVYVAALDTSGTATFSYTVADEGNATSSAIVMVEIVCEPTVTSPGVSSDVCSASPMVTSPIDPTSTTGG